MPGAAGLAQVVAATGAPSRVVTAAALAAGGRGAPWVAATLAGEARRDELLQAELASVPPRGALTAAALAEHRAIVSARLSAVTDAMRWMSLSVGPVAPGSGPTNAPPSAARVPPASAAPLSVRAFFEDHSILLLSYVGAFLLVVAAVIYEVYGVGQLSGTARFIGVLALDLFFGVAGAVCLLSTRMRLVARTYLAIFDVLLPLVAIAGYVFLGLGDRHVTIAEAQVVTGLALLILYGALALQLRSAWQAALALAAIPLVLLGAAGLTPAGEQWRAPIVALAAPLYAAVTIAAGRRAWAPPRLWLLSLVLTHLAVAFAVGLQVAAGLVSQPAASWASTAVLGVVSIAYAVLSMRERERVAPWLATVAVALTWVDGESHIPSADWSGLTTTPLVVGLAALAWLGSWAAAGSRLRRFLVPSLVIAAAAAVVAISAGIVVGGATAAAWRDAATTAAVLGTTALALRLARFRLDAPLWPLTLIAMVLAGTAALALVPALGGGHTALAAVVVGLAAAWCAASVIPAGPGLRFSLRVGTTVLAVGAVLVVDIPAPAAAGVALVATLAAAGTAVGTRRPAWMGAAVATVPALAYWLARWITGSGPATPELTWALLPAPAVAGLVALALRRGRMAVWGLPVYWAAASVAVLALGVGLAARAPEQIAFTLLVEAAVLYLIALRERAWVVLGGVFLLLAAGILLALGAAHATYDWYPAAFAAAALALYLADLIESRRLSLTPAWHVMHRAAGLGGVAVAVALGLAHGAGPQTDRVASPLGILTSLLLGGLAVLAGRRHRLRLLVRASPVLASLATVFVARWAGAVNLQWYVAGPGLTLVACGLWTSGSRHFPRPTREQVAGQALLATGLALLLGTTAGQSVWSAVVWTPTAALAAEGCLAVLCGIPLRSTVLTVGGAAAIAVAGIRALFVLAESGLLFLGLAVLAFALLAIGATLALLRNRRSLNPRR